ncbi:hypothetical protein FGO68_gene8728 [Halteria grandinella]|uniref:WKF domain-containing protein n=1 Tax=Halteria grandinella TaxID=5974 RepID=A0A8J8NDQ7_HALGN|nr:hypothetical protein FGO68_gene8728 [Halteria grandinella]
MLLLYKMSKKSRKQRERKRIVFKEHVKQNVKPLSAEQTKAKQFSRQVRKDSLEYLVNWKEHKDQWKFQKTRQIWLVKNMYNVERVPVKHFKLMKKYIKSMPEGPLKEKILAEALSMIEDKTKIKMDDIEQSLIDNTPPGQEKIAIKDRIIETKLKRAGKIAKALSKE